MSHADSILQTFVSSCRFAKLRGVNRLFEVSTQFGGVVHRCGLSYPMRGWPLRYITLQSTEFVAEFCTVASPKMQAQSSLLLVDAWWNSVSVVCVFVWCCGVKTAGTYSL